MQRRFYLGQDVFQDATYNVPGLFQDRNATIGVIQAAFDAIIAEHDIFRTPFEFNPSKGYQQVVVDEFRISVVKIGFPTLSSPDASMRIQEVLSAEFSSILSRGCETVLLLGKSTY